MKKKNIADTNKIIITSEYPTTIVEDFKMFLTYLKSHTIKLTKANGYLTKKDLLAIYSKIKTEKREVPENATQIGYPIIHLFYQLSIVLDIFRIKRSKSAAAAIVQNEQMDNFFKLTDTEQYVTLLEAFWVYADWEELQGEKWGKAPYNIYFLLMKFENIPAGKVLDLREYEDIKIETFYYGQFFHYLSYFGIWTFEIDEIKSNDPNRAKSTIPKSICLTPFYKKIHAALLATWGPYKDMDTDGGFDLFMGLLNIPIDHHNTIEVGEDESLVDLLRPLFPEGQLKTTLKRKIPTFKLGMYVFKVKLSSSCWRTVQLSSSDTLHDLHDLIQEAFGFDDDHLYAFYMDGKKFSKHCYNSAMDISGPYAHQTKIGSLNLVEGQSFLYLFDFGDEWEFDVYALKITESEEAEEPKILEIHGEAPDQYGWSF